MSITESTLESAALDWLTVLDYTVIAGDIPALGESDAELLCADWAETAG